MTASVNCWVVAVPPTSFVMCFPSPWTLFSAISMRSAAERSPR